jgi:alpha-1,2-mannosyltransferase
MWRAGGGVGVTNEVEPTFVPDSRRPVSWTVVGAGYLAAVAAVLAQHVLVPFDAEPHMGLLTNGGDLDVYRHGGLQVLHGQPLYVAKVPPGGWFTYPPFAALTFVPLSILNFAVAKGLWMLVSFAALVATIWRCATTLGWRPDRRLALLGVALAFVALDVQAVRGTLWQGQVNLVLMALVVWDLTRPNDSRWRAWSVGVAAGVKLTAIVFVPYLLLTRQWRAAATAVGTAALTVALSWLILPADSADYWLHAVVQTDRIGPLAHVGNYSVGGVLATLSAPAPMPIGWWLVGVALVGALGFCAAHRAERVGHPLLAITIVGLLSCTVPPLAWGHHWVWVVPLLAVLLDRVARTSGHARWVWAAGTTAVYLVVFMWFTAWVYREAQSLGADHPTHAAAMGAAIDEMTKWDRLLVVATHPALFVIVGCATIVLARGRAAAPPGGHIRLGT